MKGIKLKREDESTRTHGTQSVGIGCKEEIRAARKGRGTLQVAELGLLDESIKS